MKDLCSYQTVRPTHHRYTQPGYPFTLVWFATTAPLILPPEADQRRSGISPLAASETFTQRMMQNIGAGSPHANSSVNGAADISCAFSPSPVSDGKSTHTHTHTHRCLCQHGPTFSHSSIGHPLGSNGRQKTGSGNLWGTEK